MMNKRLAYRLMGIGGIVELLIALLHFVWPFELVETGEFADLTGHYSDLLFLSSVSIGLCLLVFGILSIYFSRMLRSGEKTALVYSASQSILWGGRAIGELFFHVSIPMYVIENPTMFVLPLSLLLCLVFLSPLLLWKASGKGKHVS
ncbi:MAG: hypothetical protein JW885_07015 [Deltaproteobacteria bacterium]|nr:hypothetical protein [Candidatus Zymogenaceae bacterium]